MPAHNEEVTIGRLLASIKALEYPLGRYDVFVVADNCTDRTAEIARAAGAQVEERNDYTQRGKGYALRWLLARLRERGARFDAYVVLDADTVVDASLLRRLDARFEAGSQLENGIHGRSRLHRSLTFDDTLQRSACHQLHGDRGDAFDLFGAQDKDTVRVID